MTYLVDSYEGDEHAIALFSQPPAIISTAHEGYAIKKGLLYYKDRLYVGCGGKLRAHLLALALYHDSNLGGHSGIQATYLKLKRHFYWTGMFKAIFGWVKQCDNCARCKPEHCVNPGLLQPLLIPSQF